MTGAEPADDQQPGPDDQGQQPEEGQAQPAGREAQQQRARAREAEQQRDALAARLHRSQVREVESIASRHLADAGDLLGAVGGVALVDLLGEDGEDVDAARVEAACAELVQRRGQRFARPHPLAGASFDGGYVGPATRGRQPGWGDVLTPGQRR